MRGKILVKSLGGQKRKIKIRYFVVALIFMCATNTVKMQARAESCPDLKIIFARGSGGERWHDQNYLNYKETIETKLKTTDLNYEFIDLDYPAVGVGIENLSVTLGAYFGAGDTYEFGKSVDTGVKNLTSMINSPSCKNTKYVIGGYSQGAMVISKALGGLNPERLIYAATFGDPKIYLPEGKGIIPVACRGENLSDYRMYVPDCQAYKGLLGSYIPYEPEALIGKIGTWCNKRDIFCSSHLSISDHTSYVSDNLYEDASRVIFDKITKAFGKENKISSPHDTAILIDSTGSMSSMIEKYKTEALRLAEETLNSGGRVALYDYRDLGDPYEPVQHCNFENCTLEKFKAGLATIVVDGGGDTPESLLSASLRVMKDLKWKYGSTKSLVVLTDANFLSPDRDGVTFDEVVKLSKKIDPVNFYIITNSEYGDYYDNLASQTDGKVVINFDELSLLTDYIMERYDSLPRVEENNALPTLPYLEILEAIRGKDSKMIIKFKTTGDRTLIIVNDNILGTTDGNEVIISGLDMNTQNNIILVPLGEDVRGESVVVEQNADSFGEVLPDASKSTIPKTPNTGRQ